MKVARWQARSRMIDWPNYFFGVWAPVADLYSDFNTNMFLAKREVLDRVSGDFSIYFYLLGWVRVTCESLWRYIEE